LVSVRRLVGEHKEADALEQRLLIRSSSPQPILSDGNSSDRSAGSELASQTSGALPLSVQRPEKDSVNFGEIEQLPPKLFAIQSVQYYTTHVQPMLVNRCATAGCHGSRPISPPQLEGWRYGVSASITNRNLRALAAYLDGEVRENRLFKMAITPHGGSPALTSSHDSPLQKRLAEWIDMVSNPNDMVSNPNDAGQTADFNRPTKEQEGAVTPAVYHQPMGTLQQKPSSPTRLPAVADPYDPEIFNKVYGR
jgi:hypothetical protein